jgi:hypothetical protein
MGATERILIPNALTMLSVSTPAAHTRHERGVSDRLGQTNRVDATAYRWLQSCGEVTALSRNSGTRRIREDPRGHDEAGWVRRSSNPDPGYSQS